MKNYTCPDCQGIISLDDVNVAQDIALCRSCGNTNSFSMIADASIINTAYPAGYTPKHLKIKADFMQPAVIKYHRISPAIIFLLPFTCIWSGGSMYGIYIKPLMETGHLPPMPQALFGLPFFIGTVVLLSINLYMLFGKTVVTMRKGEGDVFVGVGPFGWCRKFRYNTQTVVKLISTNVRVNNRTRSGINISTGDNDMTFGTMIDEKTKSYLAMKLKELIRSGV